MHDDMRHIGFGETFLQGMLHGVRAQVVVACCDLAANLLNVPAAIQC